ncbi:hypothetical protein [Actinocorallia aurantiaca]|uniref:hypothetical protein n=1 Tax=Actinocorallia aurantiaca TaxID=46204 RepID=UPI0031D4DA5A
MLGGREVPVDDLLPGLAGDLGGVLGQGPRLVAAQLVGPVLVAFAAPAGDLPEPPAPQATYRSLLRMRPPRG